MAKLVGKLIGVLRPARFSGIQENSVCHLARGAHQCHRIEVPPCHLDRGIDRLAKMSRDMRGDVLQQRPNATVPWLAPIVSPNDNSQLLLDIKRLHRPAMIAARAGIGTYRVRAPNDQCRCSDGQSRDKCGPIHGSRPCQGSG